jgi:hypothetical protein
VTSLVADCAAVDKQMITRQSDYCSFRDINVLVCSWNIDSAKPSELAGAEGNALFLEEVLRSVDSPEIIVFGFQEVIPLTDKKLTASESRPSSFWHQEAEVGHLLRNSVVWLG